MDNRPVIVGVGSIQQKSNYKSLDEDSLNLIKNYNQFDLRLYDEFIKNKQFN